MCINIAESDETQTIPIIICPSEHKFKPFANLLNLNHRQNANFYTALQWFLSIRPYKMQVLVYELYLKYTIIVY